MAPKSLKDFYAETAAIFPEELQKEIGHFNVFRIDELMKAARKNGVTAMPYDRRAYYKISLISGKSRAEYADKIIDIDRNALLFATPRIPYNYIPISESLSGHFCIFTPEFLLHTNSGLALDDLPIFRPGGYPVFQLSSGDVKEVAQIFLKMHKELAADYAYKYDLLRNYILELIHFGQKLQPYSGMLPHHRAADRVSAIFIELLERQFPIETPRQQLALRSAGDFATRLSVHVNHLNKVLKEATGKTTTEIIGNRLTQEAKILLRQTNWNISEIAWSLGFEELAHFSNFFKKQTGLSPVNFRQ